LRMTVGNDSIIFVNSCARTIRAVQMKSEPNAGSEPKENYAFQLVAKSNRLALYKLIQNFRETVVM